VSSTVPRLRRSGEVWLLEGKNAKGETIECTIVHAAGTPAEEAAYSLAMIHVANALLTLRAMEEADVTSVEDL
jgi:hypothetical protein